MDLKRTKVEYFLFIWIEMLSQLYPVLPPSVDGESNLSNHSYAKVYHYEYALGYCGVFKSAITMGY